MATTSPQQPHRPLIDQHQIEGAGRAFRRWLDSLSAATPQKPANDIAWEDGEPEDPHHPDPSGR